MEIDKFLKSIDNWTEWLQTSEGDEVECISIENLEQQLRIFFNEQNR